MRGALNAVPPGQSEAATALGFAGLDIWRRILMPQALRISIPPLINEFILLLKASSLVSVVGIAELTRVSMNIASQTYRPFEAYVGGGLFYLAINLMPRGLRRRLRSGGSRPERRDEPRTCSGATRPRWSAGFGVTILCWGAGGALGLCLGFAIALLYRLPDRAAALGAAGRSSRSSAARRSSCSSSCSTPAVRRIGLRLSATTAGILGLGLYSSAYFAEIFRAGFASVPAGQIEAAISVGMAPFDTLMRVTLPAALIAAVPPIVNMLIVLSKETVVLSIITVPELMYQVQTMAAETFTAFDAIFAMAVFYWLLVETVSRLGRRLEARVTAYLAREGATRERADDRDSRRQQELRRASGAARRRPRGRALGGRVPDRAKRLGQEHAARCVNFLERYDAGDMRIDGQLIGYEDAAAATRRPMSARKLREMRREIGMVFQHFNLWPHMTALAQRRRAAAAGARPERAARRPSGRRRC